MSTALRAAPRNSWSPQHTGTYCWRYQLSNTRAPCRQKYKKFGKPIDNWFFNRIWIGKGIGDGNPDWICGSGRPGTSPMAEFTDSEQDPRTGCYYFIKKSVFEETMRLMGSNHKPPCPKWPHEPWEVFMFSSKTMIWDGIYQSNSRFTWKTNISDSLYNWLVTSCLHVPHQSAPHRDNQPSKGPSVA